MFIDELCLLDQACRFQLSRIRRSLSEYDLRIYAYIDQYLKEYCEYNTLSIADVWNARKKFIQRYLKDLEVFEHTGHYPHVVEKKEFNLSRIEYDLVLISSFLLEKHRFEIARWLGQQDYNGTLVCVGVGPGVEIGIITECLGLEVKVVGYDLDLSEFAIRRFPGVLHKKFFSSSEGIFDTILLLEVLEHVSDPRELLLQSAKALRSGGKILLTTAIDIPQFDHLYNFKAGEVISMIENYSMEVSDIKTIKHLMNISNVKSENEVVVAKKVEYK